MGCQDNNDALDQQEEDRRIAIQAQREKGVKLIKAKQKALDNLVKNRQPAINPYAGMTNQMANLGVATQASEFQAEQTDIALANTLDTMAASGAGAGGATALAQAALQSKRGISASLEQQEKANQDKAAAGAQQLQAKLAEGEKYKFETTENREQQDIDRAATQLDNTEQQVQENLNALQTSYINEEQA